MKPWNHWATVTHATRPDATTHHHQPEEQCRNHWGRGNPRNHRGQPCLVSPQPLLSYLHLSWTEHDCLLLPEQPAPTVRSSTNPPATTLRRLCRGQKNLDVVPTTSAVDSGAQDVDTHYTIVITQKSTPLFGFFAPVHPSPGGRCDEDQSDALRSRVKLVGFFRTSSRSMTQPQGLTLVGAGPAILTLRTGLRHCSLPHNWARVSILRSTGCGSKGDYAVNY